MVGTGSRVMITSSIDGGHVPLEIVQRNTFAPTPRPVTGVEGEDGDEIMPVPEISVQVPVPVTGEFPAMVVVEMHRLWSGPAAAVVGTGSRVIVTSSKDGGQVPFEIVQRNTFAPTLNPVTPELGEFGDEIVPVPEISVHVPVPVDGMFPASVVDDVHSDWSGPAAAVVGSGSRVMITSSMLGGQVPFEMVQRNTFAPTPRPVTGVVGEDGDEIIPVPEISVHMPVPVTGEFPAMVVVESHSAWSGPAAAVVGSGSRVIVTSSTDEGQVPFAIVQRKTFAPTLKPVTPELGEFGDVTVPVPETSVHVPVPIAGVFPASVAEDAQIVWSGPAAAVVGSGSRVMITSSNEGGHVPFEIVQRKMFAPMPRFMMFVVGNDGAVIVPVPEISVHVPVPIDGAFPAIEVFETQIV